MKVKVKYIYKKKIKTSIFFHTKSINFLECVLRIREKRNTKKEREGMNRRKRRKREKKKEGRDEGGEKMMETNGK